MKRFIMVLILLLSFVMVFGGSKIAVDGMDFALGYYGIPQLLPQAFEQFGVEMSASSTLGVGGNFEVGFLGFYIGVMGDYLNTSFDISKAFTLSVEGNEFSPQGNLNFLFYDVLAYLKVYVIPLFAGGPWIGAGAGYSNVDLSGKLYKDFTVGGQNYSVDVDFDVSRTGFPVVGMVGFDLRLGPLSLDFLVSGGYVFGNWDIKVTSDKYSELEDQVKKEFEDILGQEPVSTLKNIYMKVGLYLGFAF